MFISDLLLLSYYEIYSVCSCSQGGNKIEHFEGQKESGDESDVLIECRDVYKSFGEKHILRGVSFKVTFVITIVANS